jgi:hypothetical protein
MYMLANMCVASGIAYACGACIDEGAFPAAQKANRIRNHGGGGARGARGARCRPVLSGGLNNFWGPSGGGVGGDGGGGGGGHGSGDVGLRLSGYIRWWWGKWMHSLVVVLSGYIRWWRG